MDSMKILFTVISLSFSQQAIAYQEGGRVVIREAARLAEEDYLTSLLEIYSTAVSSGNERSHVALEKLHSDQVLTRFSVQSLLSAYSLPRFDSIVERSQLPSERVALDLAALLCAVELGINSELEGSGEIESAVLFYDQAGVPVTVLGEIYWDKINSLETNERRRILDIIEQVERNRDELSRLRQVNESQARVRRVAKKFTAKHLSDISEESLLRDIAIRLRCDEALVLAWFDGVRD